MSGTNMPVESILDQLIMGGDMRWHCISDDQHDSIGVFKRTSTQGVVYDTTL
jgi:hypothetical protein